MMHIQALVALVVGILNTFAAFKASFPQSWA